VSIDWWTLGLQTLNVLVLLFLLQHFLYRPLAKAIAERRALALEQERATDQARRDAEAARGALDAERQRWESEREQRIDAARVEAQQTRTQLIAQAENEARERALGIARAQQQALDAERLTMQREAATLAVEVVRRLLDRLPSAALSALFLDDLCNAVHSLAPKTAAANPQALLRSAIQLDASAQARAQTALSAAWGAELALRYETAPELIAGLELHLPHSVVRSSWAQDLGSIAAALSEAISTERLAAASPIGDRP